MVTNNIEKTDQSQIVSYIAFEGEMTRMERTNHRLFILCLALLISLLLTNLGWIYYESQWEVYEEQVVEQDSTYGANNFIGRDGNIGYGKTESDN